jgi:hypothetical protein
VITLALVEEWNGSDTTLEIGPGTVGWTGESAEFTARVRYDGADKFVANGADGKKVTAGAAPPALAVDTITATPKSEGTYSTFEFTFTSSIDVPKGSSFDIWFPGQFTPWLNSHFPLNCEATGLSGKISCNAVRNKLSVTGYEARSTSADAIKLKVVGVNIPNSVTGSSASMSFDLGFSAGGNLLEYKKTHAGPVLDSAPGLLDWSSVVETSMFSRFFSDYKFTLVPANDIPSAQDGGEIWIDFPEEYDLLDANISCEGSTNFATSPTCE